MLPVNIFLSASGSFSGFEFLFLNFFFLEDFAYLLPFLSSYTFFLLFKVKFTQHNINLLNVNILVAFRRFTMLWNYNSCLVLKHFSHLVPIKQLLSIPSLRQSLVCICLDVLSPSVYFIHMESYSMWPFVPGFSHLACFQGFLHVVACISTSFFLCLSNISCIY